MLKPEDHLRWLGIDMRPRWRRRFAVIVNYIAFFAVIAVVYDGGFWGHPSIMMILLTSIVFAFGVFLNNGPVKSFEVPPPKGDFNSKYIMVNGLDDLARYRYGVTNYDAASEEQQLDLRQTYRVGTRVYPRTQDLDEQTGLDEEDWVDEREKKERVDAERWARRRLLLMIAIDIGHYLVRRTPPQSLEVAGDLLVLFILAVTLAPARILWTEPDPRRVPGEIELVHKEA